MISTVDKLLNGKDVSGYYQSAMGLWEEIWSDPESQTVDGLAGILADKQLTFESKCGGRDLGQEIMAITGIAQFYDQGAGFDNTIEKARLVRDAFQRSHCSIEVLGKASSVAEYYYLED